MLMYTIKRLIAGVITVWFIATATFIAMHQVPGDPLMNDKAVTAEIRANLEKKYGLDKPVTLHGFGHFLGDKLACALVQARRIGHTRTALADDLRQVALINKALHIDLINDFIE